MRRPGSRDVRPTTASGCRARPGNTPGLSSGDNRCVADVGTPADRTRFVEVDRQRVETNYYSKDNGGAGSSRLLRDHWDESLRRSETTSRTQVCGEEKLI